MPGAYSELYDQLRTREGWRFTEDLSFNSSITTNAGTAGQSTTLLPIKFNPIPDLNLVQQVGATAAYLILRRLSMSFAGSPDFRYTQRWINLGSFQQSFTATASTTGGIGIITLDSTGLLPAGGSASTFLFAVRRVFVEPPPANVTITAMKYKSLWTSGSGSMPISDFKLISPISGAYDMGQFGENDVGIVTAAGKQIQFQFTYTNTNVTDQTVLVDFYLMGAGLNWQQYRVQYQDWNKGLHNIGYVDTVLQPVVTYNVDQMIPIPLTDPGQNNTLNAWGNIFLTLLGQENFYGINGTPFDVMLTATIAYLLPYNYGG